MILSIFPNMFKAQCNFLSFSERRVISQQDEVLRILNYLHARFTYKGRFFCLKLLIAFKSNIVYQFIIKDYNLSNMQYFYFNEMDIFLSWIRDLQSNNSCFQA